jgi:hypothetical protein
MSHIVVDSPTNRVHDFPRRATNESAIKVTLLKNIARFLLGFLLLGAVLYFVADFSIRQSAALALFAAYVIYGLRMMTLRPDLIFLPHFIHIRPRWYEILTDLELISAAEEYDKLYQAFNALSPEQYNVFRDGVWFTVLDSETIGQRTLIYSDDYHNFVSKVDFERNLKPLTLWRESEEPSLGEWPVEFFVKGGGGTYRLGVIVPEWWWVRKETKLGGKLLEIDRCRAGIYGTVELTIATIPGSEFTTYWKRSDPYRKGDDIWRKLCVEDREKFGWTVEDKPERNSPEMLKHKYFEVRHRGI